MTRTSSKRMWLGLGPAGRSAGRSAGGFTLIEVLVSIGVIGVLIGILIVAGTAVVRGARATADRAAAGAIATGIEAFKLEFGDDPLLVHDGDVMSVPRPVRPRTSMVWGASPVDDASTPWRPAVYGAGDGFYRGLNGVLGDGSGVTSRGQADQRYSKFTLSYYVSGLLGSAVDGVEGPGMAPVERDGSFRGVTTEVGARRGTTAARTRFEPFYEPDAGGTPVVREYRDAVEARENGLSALNGLTGNGELFHTVLVDRNGRAFRFYRWAQGRSDGAAVTGVLDLNIPEVLLDPVLLHEAYGGSVGGADVALSGAGFAAARSGFNVMIDPAGGDAELKGATWAVVGAGPDGVFGTEAIDDLRLGLRGRAATGTPGADREARRQARQDNAVVTGR